MKSEPPVPPTYTTTGRVNARTWTKELDPLDRRFCLNGKKGALHKRNYVRHALRKRNYVRHALRKRNYVRHALRKCNYVRHALHKRNYVRHALRK
eukprot:1182221-Prorocentrum_minimum.AAC.5